MTEYRHGMEFYTLLRLMYFIILWTSLVSTSPKEITELFLPEDEEARYRHLLEVGLCSNSMLGDKWLLDSISSVFWWTRVPSRTSILCFRIARWVLRNMFRKKFPLYILMLQMPQQRRGFPGSLDVLRLGLDDGVTVIIVKTLIWQSLKHFEITFNTWQHVLFSIMK